MQLFANNAESTLNAPIGAGALSIQVASGEGSRFPAISGGDFFIATLCKVLSGIESSIEIIKVTARSGDVFTVLRAQEGTTALTYAAGDKVSLRLTAAGINNLVQLSGSQTLANKTLTSPVINGFSGTGNGYLAGNVVIEGSLTVGGPSSVLGYAEYFDTGGSVTQLTSKITSVTLNKPTGRIITHNSEIPAGEIRTFTFNNNLVDVTDTLLIQPTWGVSPEHYSFRVSNIVTSPGFCIVIKNEALVPLSEAITLNFSIIKGAIN